MKQLTSRDYAQLKKAVFLKKRGFFQRVVKKTDPSILTNLLMIHLYEYDILHSDFNHDICEMLVNNGALNTPNCLNKDFAEYNYDSSNPLTDLLRRGFYDIADLYFKRGSKLNFIQDMSTEVLYELFKLCDKERLKIIISDNASFIEIPDETIEKLLYFAASDNDPELINFLLKTRPNISINKPFGNLHLSAVHIACMQTALESLQVLLKQNPVIDFGHQTAFHALCNYGNPVSHNNSHLKLKIDRENRRDRYLACKNFDELNVELSKPKQPEPHIMTEEENQERRLKMLNLLCELPHDINKKDSSGNTPLHRAAINELSYSFILRLIKDGANPSIKNRFDQTPLDVLDDNSRRRKKRPDHEAVADLLKTRSIKDKNAH